MSEGQVLLETLPGEIALIRLGAESEAVVTFTVKRMESLENVLSEVEKSKPAGVVIAGSTDSMFSVGADINLIRDVLDAKVGTEMAKRGQEVFARLEALPCPTVAAISGPCVGGACELALACDHRIISDAKGSAIGLPEIKLGILPGFGGTQRLPRLIGLPRALDIILAGKVLKPSQAKKVGLVDEVLKTEKLLKRAAEIASGVKRPAPPKISLIHKFLSFNGIGRAIVKNNAASGIKKKTKGFYPAPPAALETTLYGLEKGTGAGYLKEAEELGRLAVTPESKALVRIFFLTENSKGIGKSARKDVSHVQGVVVGAGVMGAGIAGTMIKNGCSVILKDTSKEGLNRGSDQIKKYINGRRGLSEQEKSFMLNRLETTTQDSTNLGNANFAIEAIFEDLHLKKSVLGELAKLMPQDAIIATNTSSLSVTEIATAIDPPERVVGMHFFNPVEKMPLVEIIHGEKTSNKTIAIVAALATKLGKFPIVVSDVPGFLVNRILAPYLSEAGHLLAEGYSISDIDKAATSFGMPMGPVRLLDEVGLDVAMHVSQIMIDGYGDRMKGPGYANKLVEAGRKGKKNGKGFYDYSSDQKKGTVDPEVRKILELPAAKKDADRKYIQERLILTLINEAVRCLDEGVAGEPGPQAVDQIDLGTVMGIGFPPFLGGLLNYADSVGSKEILEKLEKLHKECGDRLKPADGIVSRGKDGKLFRGEPPAFA